MDFWTIVLFSLVIGILLVGCGVLIVYLGALAKNAYQIKIELQQDLANGLQALEKEAEKTSRRLKRELAEEAERSREGLGREIQASLNDIVSRVNSRAEEIETAQRIDRTNATASANSLKKDIFTVEQRLKLLRRDLDKRLPPPPPEETAPAADAGESPAEPAAAGMVSTVPAVEPAPAAEPVTHA